MMVNEDENSDIDVETVDSSSPPILCLEKKTQSPPVSYSSNILKSFVSARTDGIRGPRYGDYDVNDISTSSDNEDKEDGEVVSSDSSQNTSPKKLNTFKGNVYQPEGRVLQSWNQYPGSKRPRSVMDNHLNHDLYEIELLHLGQTTSFTDGVAQLLSQHRDAVQSRQSEDSDSSGNIFPHSESSDDDDEDMGNIFNERKSLVGELQDLRNLNIRDHANMEVYPEVNIIDLQLSEIEEILPLGFITQIVEGFVVIKNSKPGTILDLDSMVFDNTRKCIGYIFEALGPVTDPFYSIRFNTGSDIELLGLKKGQEVFYSTNDRYTRYLMLDLLRDVEQRDGSNSSSSSDEEDGSERSAPRPRKTPVRMRNRTTCNYAVSYQKVMPPQQGEKDSNQQPVNVNAFSWSQNRQNNEFKNRILSSFMAD